MLAILSIAQAKSLSSGACKLQARAHTPAMESLEIIKGEARDQQEEQPGQHYQQDLVAVPQQAKIGEPEFDARGRGGQSSGAGPEVVLC